ncbi:hypothetical protein OG500_04160 [Kitasatospora sp. NBC_01250]|uniref:hypothetical protein n=1 Tax=Kitasatospora sp. NBC_01250 TaxID=2903571 RepID=UPI002E2FDB74|nr:hypothetical protein [Kitasatospora sp. NBC_01250]
MDTHQFRAPAAQFADDDCAVPAVDFALLLHAYGTASDTPAQLRALAAGDQVARRAALAHLNSAIVHQGTPWTATGPVARQLCVMLRQDAIADAETLARTLRFLAEVAEAAGLGADEDLTSVAACAGRDIAAEVTALLTDPAEPDGADLVYEDEDRADALCARAVLDCRAALPAIADAARQAASHPDDQVRDAAVRTTAEVARVTARLAP